MSVGTEIWLFSLSVIASALGGMLGMASGIFIVPILTTLCHVDLRNAIGASIVSVIACSCGSAAAFLKERLRFLCQLLFSGFRLRALGGFPVFDLQTRIRRIGVGVNRWLADECFPAPAIR